MSHTIENKMEVNIQKLLSDQVNAIAEQLYKQRDAVLDCGLLSGNAGIALFYGYLAKQYPESNYFDKVTYYLDKIGDAISKESLNPSMSVGVGGIAFVFQHLRNIGLLDIEEDLNLAELDEFLDKAADIDFTNENWDPLHGMVGLGIYFLERNRETGDKKFLEKIVDNLAKMVTTVDGHQIWVTPGYAKFSVDNYNFGMAHGMPGILSFLALVLQRGIRENEIKEMINSALPFLLKNNYPDDQPYCFPGSIDVVKKETNENYIYARLGWCYGDLCMTFALLHCGKALENASWIENGIAIAHKASRRTLENSGCVDSGICHGAVGLAHQFLRLYKFTGDETFKVTAVKWIQHAQQDFYKPDLFEGGYFSKTYEEKSESYKMCYQAGLLEGNAGIGLVYLSYLNQINPDWDIIFLTNV